jgi:anthranilate synthase component 1
MRPAYLLQWLDHVPDLLALSRAHPDRFPYLLESAARGPLGGHSLLLFASHEVLRREAGGGLEGPGEGAGFFARLRHWYRREALPAAGATNGATNGKPPPFAGGWFIYLGYEMAAEVEPTLELPRNDTGLPDAVAHRCPAAIIVYHGSGHAAPDRAAVVAESPELLAQVLERVGDGEALAVTADLADPELAEITEEDPARFEASVRRIHEYLRAGDVFQVNISRPWTGRFRAPPDPYRLYRSLRRANPAPFAGLMRWGEHFLLSSSPERLVQTRDGTVQTRPIAGTRPRGADREQDQALSEELIGNIKERAEHVMLIDLERNDLGRVCRPGTVTVDELMVVETYAHVHHIVSNVRGELAAGAGPVEAMKAVFPGGTITGCPKVRCMQIIAELEGEGRGFYTGSMGYLGRDGSMDLNILIRSMLVHGPRFRFRTGAGIVADSEAKKEVQETADKARGILLAVESHGKETRSQLDNIRAPRCQ